ncbi:hypothetical protein F5884DRAFT_850763 [Xylogone sp. PMI_703]|nr:hypothetical protein F5884DRAFT_850763 [Xylogone sp. PMI_703]
MMYAKILTCLSIFSGFGLAAPIQGIHWIVRDLTRVYNPVYNNFEYNFIISANNAPPDQVCHITIPTTQDSWYAVPCASNWQISWGYNAGTDSAVMTVLNVQLQQDAWFGFDRVTSTIQHPDVGPNPVYPVGSFVAKEEEK